eukprot:m.49206 g.49206  ORF g.49206 m.49206 type:complete len:571 (+) comp11080_c0_seq1:105-1817(+)
MACLRSCTRATAFVATVAVVIVCGCMGGGEMVVGASSNITFQAWQSQQAKLTIPEQGLQSVRERPNVGLAFSGGGSRAFLLTLGYIEALTELGLIDNARYITTVSGSGWALAGYMFSDVTKNDTTLLGAIRMPENITEDNSKSIEPMCLRGAPVNSNFETQLIEAILNPLVHGKDIWTHAVDKVFMQPFGVPSDKYMTQDTQTLAQVLENNPALNENDFVVPKTNRPFWIASATYVGPEPYSPYGLNERNYSMLDMTPFYTGELFTRDATFGKVQRTIGGAVESFAFGSETASPTLKPSEKQGVLVTGAPAAPFSPVHAASISSFAPGATVAALSKKLSVDIDPVMNYWSPSSSLPTTDVALLADGGCIQNTNIIGLLQRGVTSIVAFFNPAKPLNSTFDPTARPTSADDIDDGLPSFFGVFVDASYNILWDISHNQVFDQKDYAGIVNQLTASMRNGLGAVAQAEVTTVDNDWWGIKAGMKVNLTVVYLARALQWEAALPSDLRTQIQPAVDPQNPSNLHKGGTFEDFPNVSTYGDVHPSALLANMLSDLAGWIVYANKNIFKKALLAK